jgi:NADP-dependent aldehyde dehydrogenase
VRTIRTFNCRENSLNTSTYTISTQEELGETLAHAEAIHRSTVWQNQEVRKTFFTQLSACLLIQKSAIEELYCSESSLSHERFEREFQRTLNQLDAYIKEGLNRLEECQRSELSDRTLEKRWLPVGPVAVFGASNFPLAYGTLGGDALGALAAGCPVIVKGHPLHAGTSSLLAQIAHEVLAAMELPKGIFGHVLDDGFALGCSLIQDARIKAGAFTGSQSGGMALTKLAQDRKHPIPFFAEMGSLNPVIFSNNCSNKTALLSALAKAVTEDAGQFCTKPGILFVPSEAAQAMEQAFKILLKDQPSHPMLHPSIYEKYCARLEALENQGVKVTRFKAELPWHADRAFTSITFEQLLQTDALHHEVFGPFTCLVSYEYLTQVEALLASIGGQLTVTLIGTSVEIEPLKQIAQRFCGRMIINGVPTGVVVDPAMHHGGPFPSSSDARFTSVGEDSLKRFIRPFCLQKN